MAASTDTMEKPTKARQFLTWTEFCNKVAVEICLTQQGSILLGTFGESDLREKADAAVSPFLSMLRKAYLTLRLAHEKGSAEFGA